MSSWQKLGVLYVISGRGIGGVVLRFTLGMRILTSIVGGFGGVGQVFYRSIISYSSLVHSGWIMVVCLVREGMFLVYYLVYSFIAFFLFRLFNFLNTLNLRINRRGPIGRDNIKFWLIICVLSLGGLPPMVGALLKLIGISVLVKVSFILLGFLLLSSVVGLFYYLRIFFRIRFSVFSAVGVEEGSRGSIKKINNVGKIFGLVNLLLGRRIFLTIRV